MNSDRWQRAREVFERALEAADANRAALLDDACGSDSELRGEVESLLRHHQQLDGRFLEPQGPKLRLDSKESEAWAENLIGKKIARYTVVRLIGRGGMGCVFEARQERPARGVALKVVRPGFSAASAMARFRLEPEVLGRLQHPNIAQVYEAGVHEDEQGPVPYFAMEYIAEAKPLIDHCETARLTTRQRLELFAKVCDAVHHGHQKGIIHRDLKPANILVGRDGEPKVIDFGVARASDADIMMTTQCTQVGDLIGTVHYMSPEQCDANPNNIDTRSDVYSLGVVLFELLTGSAPYATSGTTLYSAVRAIKEEAPQAPGKLNRRLRGDVEAILLKSLEKEPARRYASAADFGQDIRRHLHGEPIEARRTGMWLRLVRWANRRPRAAAMIGAAAFFGLSAILTIGLSKAYVWHQLQKPKRVQLVDSTRVHLFSRNDTVIHSWLASEGESLGFAEKVEPFLKDPDHSFAIIGTIVHGASKGASGRSGELRVYDHTKDYDKPVWTHRLSPEDMPEYIINQGVTIEAFNPAQVWLLDVLPERDTEPAFEILCQYSHAISSLRAMCIYDVRGRLLYQFWQDGGVSSFHWLSGPGLLLVAGENWEKYPIERGCTNVTSEGAVAMVVYALRPALGDTSPRMVHSEVNNLGGELAWYKWLQTCPIAKTYWGASFSAPRNADASSVAVLSLEILTDPRCGMEWHIDANGNRIDGTLVAPTYLLMRTQIPTLPPLEAFELGDHPPSDPSP